MTKPFRILRHNMPVEAQKQAKEKAAKLLEKIASLESASQTLVKEHEVTSASPSSKPVPSSRIRQKT